MNIHFIAIGGSAMHNLAIALKEKGHEVSGSDDEVREPSRSRLLKHGLLPEKEGWDTNRVHERLDAVILGMHAREDNPELLKARELELDIFSYPQFLYEETKGKIRAVIGGSHGKTTITAMVMHVLKHAGKAFDYMVGAQIEGFDTMVGLQENSSLAVFEGDEYMASALDKRPKFHLYHPHVAVISGIAWDHINVFPSSSMYKEQFVKFAGLIEPKGKLIYCKKDRQVDEIALQAREDIQKLPYQEHPAETRNGKTFLITAKQGHVPVQIFGTHNLQNLEGARQVCLALGVSDKAFYQAIQSFKGAANRLEKVMETPRTIVLKDFAHAPSKVEATVASVKKQFPGKKLVACLELHTFSSLNKAFLKEYRGKLLKADVSFVYFSPGTVAHKKLEKLTRQEVKTAFGDNNMQVFDDIEAFQSGLKSMEFTDTVLLIMSSGNFGGIEWEKWLLPNIS